MSTTTTLKVGVDLLTKSATYMANTLVQMGFRIEHGRLPSGHYMVDNQQVVEQGFRVWVAEGTLLKVHFELYSATSDQGYERCTIELEYLADPKGADVRKPPIDTLEALFARLEKLPPDATFGLLVTLAPGHTEVPGWGPPTTLKELSGGVKEEIEVGDGHGFGHIFGRTRYLIANRYGKAGDT